MLSIMHLQGGQVEPFSSDWVFSLPLLYLLMPAWPDADTSLCEDKYAAVTNLIQGRHGWRFLAKLNYIFWWWTWYKPTQDIICWNCTESIVLYYIYYVICIIDFYRCQCSWMEKRVSVNVTVVSEALHECLWQGILKYCNSFYQQYTGAAFYSSDTMLHHSPTNKSALFLA